MKTVSRHARLARAFWSPVLSHPHLPRFCPSFGFSSRATTTHPEGTRRRSVQVALETCCLSPSKTQSGHMASILSYSGARRARHADNMISPMHSEPRNAVARASWNEQPGERPAKGMADRTIRVNHPSYRGAPSGTLGAQEKNALSASAWTPFRLTPTNYFRTVVVGNIVGSQAERPKPMDIETHQGTPQQPWSSRIMGSSKLHCLGPRGQTPRSALKCFQRLFRRDPSATTAPSSNGGMPGADSNSLPHHRGCRCTMTAAVRAGPPPLDQGGRAAYWCTSQNRR